MFNKILVLIFTNLLSLGPSALWAAPIGEQIIRGHATFQRAGALTTITADHQSIINYQSFDIARQETVQFVQPGSEATVLNRITASDNPTSIQGSLRANGQVYLVNPAGIMFGRNAVVDVGGLYAAAGNIADQDFLNGLNRFSNLTGSVTNQGRLLANDVVLAGKNAANLGSITARKDYVALAAGSEVLVGERGKSIYVAAPPADSGTQYGVTNSGNITVQQGNALIGVGDLYSLAIQQSGIIKAKEV